MTDPTDDPTPDPIGARVARLTAQIERHRAAMLRRAKKLDEMPAYPGECCPSCKYGKAFSVPAEQQARCGANLVRLLRKRGADGDAEEVEAIEMGAWP